MTEEHLEKFFEAESECAYIGCGITPYNMAVCEIIDRLEELRRKFPVGTKIMLTECIRLPEEYEFFGVGTVGIVNNWSGINPRITIDGFDIVVLPKQIRKSPW